jgi:hypothetical protein
MMAAYGLPAEPALSTYRVRIPGRYWRVVSGYPDRLVLAHLRYSPGGGPRDESSPSARHSWGWLGAAAAHSRCSAPWRMVFHSTMRDSLRGRTAWAQFSG